MVVNAQPSPKPPPDGIYTEAQAKRGQSLFTENCANCHGMELTGDQFAPPLTGAVFVAKWKDRPVADLFELMRVTMPQTAPGGFNRQQNADMLAFILQKNRLPAGKSDLPPQAEALSQIKLAMPVSTVSAPVVPPDAPRVRTSSLLETPTAGGFYTVEQAERGRVQFDRWCTPCHLAESTPVTPSTTGRGFWLGSQHLILNLGGRYAHKYPSVYHLYRRVRDTMPSFNADAIGPAMKVD